MFHRYLLAYNVLTCEREECVRVSWAEPCHMGGG